MLLFRRREEVIYKTATIQFTSSKFTGAQSKVICVFCLFLPLVDFLGDGGDSVGSKFLKGCVKKIQVQGKDLDLDLAVKHTSISSYSCPA